MSDQPPADLGPRASSWRIVFAVAALAYCGGMGVAITFYGTPGNPLQATMLAGCIETSWMILGGVGFGSLAAVVMQYVPLLLGKKA